MTPSPSEITPQNAPPVWSDGVRELLARRPVFDAHCDAIARAVDLGDDLAERTTSGHFDCVRGAEGGLGAWVVVAWVDPARDLERSFDRASEMFAAAHDLAARRPDRFRIVGNAEELSAAHDARVVAGIPGIEGGHAIEGSIDKLHWFFERGLRVMTLVWNNHLPWIRSCDGGAGADIPIGLSEFGRRVVAELNQLGIVVDLSHAGERSFYDALDATSKPPIASHSGCMALHEHPRNLTDDQLRALAQHDGVAGIVFHPGFLDADARREEMRVRTTNAYTSIDMSGNREQAARGFLEQQRVMQRDARPMPASRLVEHIAHAVDVAGIDHVGIGSDYDGIQRTPQWLESASSYGTLAELLVRRGFTLTDVEKVLGGNMRRVFETVTGKGMAAHAAQGLVGAAGFARG